MDKGLDQFDLAGAGGGVQLSEFQEEEKDLIFGEACFLKSFFFGDGSLEIGFLDFQILDFLDDGRKGDAGFKDGQQVCDALFRFAKIGFIFIEAVGIFLCFGIVLICGMSDVFQQFVVEDQFRYGV